MRIPIPFQRFFGGTSCLLDICFLPYCTSFSNWAYLLSSRTMATALLTTIMYAVQIVQDGQYVLPSLPVLKNCLFAKAKNPDEGSGEEVEEEVPSSPATSLMSIYESTESFLFGMGRLFPALIVLTLAWATGDIMTSVGADRLFSKLITEGVNAEAMPTLAFVIAVIMALATGSSWSTMTILFPLISE